MCKPIPDRIECADNMKELSAEVPIVFLVELFNNLHVVQHYHKQILPDTEEGRAVWDSALDGLCEAFTVVALNLVKAEGIANIVTLLRPQPGEEAETAPEGCTLQ